MRFNPQTHHRRSVRLPNHDYSSAGAYFVTICTRNRECLFGSVVNGVMVLNDAGRTAESYWRETPEHYPDVMADVYVVMPNHVHGILVIKNGVGANNYSPLRNRPCGTSRTVGAIVRGYKIGVTKWMRENTDMHDVWQRNYYERVIRDEGELNRVRQYIADNPLKWDIDSENPNNIRDSLLPKLMSGEIRVGA